MATGFNSAIIRETPARLASNIGKIGLARSDLRPTMIFVSAICPTKPRSALGDLLRRYAQAAHPVFQRRHIGQ